MFRRFSVNDALLAMGLDAAAVWAALAIATRLRPWLSQALPFAAEYPFYIPAPWLIYLVFAGEWILIGLLLDVYDNGKHLRPADEFTRLALSSLLAAMALAGTLYLSYREISRLLFLVFVGLAYLFMLSWRLLRRVRTLPAHRRRLLIVGRSPSSQELQAEAGANPAWGIQVTQALEDGPDLVSRVEQALQEQAIEDVLIALPHNAYPRMEELVVRLHRFPVHVWVIPDYFRLALHRAGVQEFAGIPLLDLRAPALSEAQRLIKRLFDLAVSLLSLPLALPLMGLIALAIRLESPGPALFKQERVGENGRLFGMHKFRTMRHEATAPGSPVEQPDEKGEWVHKRPDDPRLTRLGRFLRRASLDELPQLFNVLKGEMSLVGPRPELPFLVDRYEDWQRQRFVVPQGLTGWWQINGRSDRPMHLNTQDDLYYVQHYSLALDIYILLKTISVVLSGKGAF